ncbi:MAG: hypothetical protein A2086_13390 [Spirochaetes bacterium GWD1_27_9]|nr:MAG: hypothetical protein A2Z98_02135 [Spirochaetes bacterium GWB1_27_13]OHD23088.1 MAG: hypothetical protein A2Y34_16875 [Spirochaetes bacterium GWC1_27_15]OHD39900.1 MAG: hypothetical protein A2086_13390 [Spirochaetes bacterium GWD1_27_9]
MNQKLKELDLATIKIYISKIKEFFIKNHIVILLSVILFLTFSCSFAEPSTLIIENNSKYTIKVNSNKGNKNEMTIKKTGVDFILTYPDDIKLDISIEETGFNKEYDLKINYMEKKKFVFNLSE